jgi:hypothetical protein
MRKATEMAQIVATAADASGVEDVELSPEESRAAFDARARHLLGMSGEDFLRKWREGAFEDVEERPEVAELIHLAPFAE